MAGVLEQEEIDALMGGLSSGKLDTADGDGTGGGVNNYDFSKQHYALKRLLPALEGVCGQYADAIKEKLSRVAPSIESVAAEPIAVLGIEELLPRLTTPCRIACISAAPLTRPVLLIIESDLVFDMVNRYFGGGSGLRKTRASERFSATEMRLSDLICEELIADLEPAWHNLLSIKPEIKRWENDLRFIDEFDEDETLIATRFSVSFGATDGGLWLVVPWGGIEPVRESLGGIARHNMREKDPQWHARLRQGLDDAELELVAVLSQSRIKLKRALALKKGDVIAIGDPTNIQLHIDGIPLLRASFGTHEGQMAAKIIEPVRGPLPAAVSGGKRS